MQKLSRTRQDKPRSFRSPPFCSTGLRARSQTAREDDLSAARRAWYFSSSKAQQLEGLATLFSSRARGATATAIGTTEQHAAADMQQSQNVAQPCRNAPRAAKKQSQTRNYVPHRQYHVPQPSVPMAQGTQGADKPAAWPPKIVKASIVISRRPMFFPTEPACPTPRTTRR